MGFIPGFSSGIFVRSIYRRFIPGFSSIASPLYDLLRGGASWRWEGPQHAAFDRMKELLCSEPIVLALPNDEDEFEVATDASNVGIGAVLSQKGRVIEYASRRLNPAEQNYSVTERELLAIVWAIEKWRKYLFGKRFLLTTDHRPLTFLQTVKEPKGRMARWIARVQEYDFRVQYKRGQDNGVADCLSRAQYSMRPLEHETLPASMNPVCALTFYDDLKSLAEQQHQDCDLHLVMGYLQRGHKGDSENGSQRRLLQLWKQLSLSNEGVLMRSFRRNGGIVRVPVIPASRRRELLERYHSSAHLGVQKTYDLLKTNAYWPGMETCAEICFVLLQMSVGKIRSEFEQSSIAADLYVRAHGNLVDGYHGSPGLYCLWEEIRSGSDRSFHEMG